MYYKRVLKMLLNKAIHGPPAVKYIKATKDLTAVINKVIKW